MPQSIREYRERLAEAEQAIREAAEHEDLSFVEEYYLKHLVPPVDKSAVEAYLRQWDEMVEEQRKEKS